MSLILAVLAQVGPFVGSPAAAPPRPAVEGRQSPRKRAAPQPERPPQAPTQGRLQACLDLAAADAFEAVEQAEDWLEKTQGSARAEPQQCLGEAHAALGDWSDAEAAFLAARNAAAAGDRPLRAQLGGMAGNAALAAGAPDRALAALEVAQADAAASNSVKLAGEIALDRARALVALKRNEDAAKALVEARTSTPDNPLAWLLSATLSRRMNKLAEAQAQIGTAAQLDPKDPEIGLEAGLIAVMSGHDDAARKSWQSVVDMAPQSEAATTARGYIAQLGTPPSPPSTASKP